MPEMTPYHQIVELVTWLRNNSASSEEVDHHLRMLEVDLDGWAQRIRAIEIPHDSQNESLALVADSLASLDLFREAIVHVREYALRRDESVAETAIDKARRGLELMLSVKSTTEDNVERILDEADL